MVTGRKQRAAEDDFGCSPLKAVYLRQDHLEGILVIFGRRALNFFCLKALGKYEK